VSDLKVIKKRSVEGYNTVFQQITGKVKDKGHPRTGHKGPDWE
jgi:hypothetical protein